MSNLEPVNKLVFLLMALLAGILGGLFGLGGGMLISPLLLHVGIPPEVAAATYLLLHGVLLLFHVLISELVARHGARRHRACLCFRMFCRVTCWPSSAAESNTGLWKDFTDCVLS